ncbi:hypothetical protein AB0E04_48165 [Streptomyces sp. NPDC048251]|uniref:hypothetical protein n=1 Tax=Streptomyces sp. NPDC048251 TaxID=3154501 RepID=UPI003439C15D
MGLAFAAMTNAVIETVPATHTGEATGVNTIVRTIGSAVSAAVIASDSTPQGLPTDQAFTTGFRVCAGVALLAVLALPSAPRRHGQAVAAGVEDLPPEPGEALRSRRQSSSRPWTAEVR